MIPSLEQLALAGAFQILLHSTGSMTCMAQYFHCVYLSTKSALRCRFWLQEPMHQIATSVMKPWRGARCLRVAGIISSSALNCLQLICRIQPCAGGGLMLTIFYCWAFFSLGPLL